MSMTWKRTVDWSADDWRDDSACRDTHPSIFFPVTEEEVLDAKSVCRNCVVKDECLDFALRANQENGIWGGTTEDERRRLRRQWLAARRKARAAGIAV